MRIQRFDGNEWVVAPSTPSVVWPRIKQFLSDNGVAVVREVPEAGILETETLELTLQGRYRDIVRTVLSETPPGPFETAQLRVEQAVRAGATEIHLVLLSTAGPRSVRSWPGRTARAGPMRRQPWCGNWRTFWPLKFPAGAFPFGPRTLLLWRRLKCSFFGACRRAFACA